jgi:hypothetical protein
MKLIVAVLLIVLPTIAYRQGRIEADRRATAAEASALLLARDLAAMRDSSIALEVRSLLLERQVIASGTRIVALMEEVRLDTRPQPELVSVVKK